MTIHRARKPHKCSVGAGHRIAPGQRYVRQVVTPWGGTKRTKGFVTHCTCLKHARELGIVVEGAKA